MGCFVLNKLWEIVKNVFNKIFQIVEFIDIWFLEILIIIIVILE